MLILGLLHTQSDGQEINKTSSLPPGTRTPEREKHTWKRGRNPRPSLIRAGTEGQRQQENRAGESLTLQVELSDRTYLSVWVFTVTFLQCSSRYSGLSDKQGWGLGCTSVMV